MKAMLLALVLSLTTSVLCQTPAAPASRQLPVDQQASKEDVLRLMDVLKLRENMKQMLAVMGEHMSQSMDAVLDRQMPNVSVEERAKLKAEINAESKETLDQMLAGDFVNGVIEDMVPVYQRHFSKADMDAIVAFYLSPAGQHFVDAMPAVTAEGMAAMQPRMQAEMEKAMEKARARAEQRIKEAEAASADTKPPAKARPAAKPAAPKKKQ
jgi:hypothetical protein